MPDLRPELKSRTYGIERRASRIAGCIPRAKEYKVKRRRARTVAGIMAGEQSDDGRFLCKRIITS